MTSEMRGEELKTQSMGPEGRPEEVRHLQLRMRDLRDTLGQSEGPGGLWRATHLGAWRHWMFDLRVTLGPSTGVGPTTQDFGPCVESCAIPEHQHL